METNEIVNLLTDYIELKGGKVEILKQDKIAGESLTCYAPVVLAKSDGLPTAYLLPLATTGPLATLITPLFDYQIMQCQMIQKELDELGVTANDLHLAVTIYTIAIVDNGQVANFFTSNEERNRMFDLMKRFYTGIKNDPRLVMGGIVTMIPAVKIGLTVINTALNYIMRVKHQFLYVETYLNKQTGEFNKQELFDDLDFRLGL